MEYASEGDLADLIAKRADEKKGFTEDEIMFWMLSAAFPLMSLATTATINWLHHRFLNLLVIY
eukprot:692299-Pelagomonas_calceolata.AAC.4